MEKQYALSWRSHDRDQLFHTAAIFHVAAGRGCAGTVHAVIHVAAEHGTLGKTINISRNSNIF